MIRGNLLVFGAGCIGRGLLGELAFRAGISLTFVESSPALATRLAEARDYAVHLCGGRRETSRVSGFSVIAATDHAGLAAAVARCTFAATAVGSANIGGVAAVLAPALAGRREPLVVLVCENTAAADAALAAALEAAGAPDGRFRCVAVSVERMVRRAAGDTLDLHAEAGQSMFVDGRALAGLLRLPGGFEVVDDLAPWYARKLYTNNAGHALLAYEGHREGCRLLWQALEREAIRARLESLLEGAGEAVSREYRLDRPAMRRHLDELLRERYANRDLADTVERVARNPLRKLGPGERLAGLLRLLQRHGLPVVEVAGAIAAAMRYVDPADEETVQMRRLIERGGPGLVLESVCRISAAEPVFRDICDEWRRRQ